MRCVYSKSCSWATILCCITVNETRLEKSQCIEWTNMIYSLPSVLCFASRASSHAKGSFSLSFFGSSLAQVISTLCAVVSRNLKKMFIFIYIYEHASTRVYGCLWKTEERCPCLISVAVKNSLRKSNKEENRVHGLPSRSSSIVGEAKTWTRRIISTVKSTHDKASEMWHWLRIPVLSEGTE